MARPICTKEGCELPALIPSQDGAICGECYLKRNMDKHPELKKFIEDK